MMRTAAVGILAIFLFLQKSHALLRQERRAREESTVSRQYGTSYAVLSVGREMIIKKDVVEQLRILRSKPSSNDSSPTKSTKGMKKTKKTKSSKSMKQKQVKSPKGAKSAGGDLSLPGSSVDDSDDSDQSSNEDDSDVSDQSSNEDDGDDTDQASGEDGDDTDQAPGETEFDISDCDSYSNDWLLELAEYCGPDLEDLTGCECPTAGDLLADGTLTCATAEEKDSSPPACPKGCPVCEFCMVLEGCEDIYD